MNRLSDIQSLARLLMNEHGLREWLFKFDKAKRRAGQCKYRRKTISLSMYFAANNPLEEVRDTILHEIAHALAGYKAGHGPEWKAVCNLIGARPRACYDSTTVKMPPKKLRAVCGGCNREFGRHKRPARNRIAYCAVCGPKKGRLEFKTVSMRKA